MQITFLQGILLSIFGAIAGLDSYTEALYIFRPIISCAVTGLILGDPVTGLLAGGIAELTFAGLTNAGGTQPPNPAVCGIMTVVIAHTTKVAPATAVGLSLPFAMLMQYIILMYYSLFSGFMPTMDKAAQNADTGKFNKFIYFSMFVMAATFFVIIFLLLRVNYVPYLLLGFVIASFINYSNVLPAAVIGIVFAMIDFFNNKQHQKLQAQIDEVKENGGSEDGI